MNYHKFLLPLLFVMSLFLVVACEGQQQQQTTGAFIGGTTGLIAGFEPLGTKETESGLYTLFDTEGFPLEIALHNKGEQDIPVGKVTLKLLGPAREEFRGIVPANWETNNKQQIDKVSEFNPQGGEEVVSFTPGVERAKFTGTVTTFRDVVWNLEYWYDYKTHVILNDVCFKGNPTDEKVCTITEPKAFSVSGAPITVTAASEDQAGKGVIMVKVAVQNVGKGKATIPGKEFDQRFDQITYAVDEPTKWECKSSGRENEARLIESRAEIICRLKQPLNVEDLYTKTVGLTLSYTYKELIQEKLRIKESAK